MGIRFACPNGHPLHVKAELSGKRGICPECQSRFVIPAAPAAKAKPQAAQQPEPAQSAPAQASKQPEPQQTETHSEPGAEVPTWYVRPASGGQFGPADDVLIKQWAAEGRVAADAYVWRTGWPDWRRAAELPEYFPQLAHQAAAAAPLDLPTEYNDTLGTSDGSPVVPADVSLATAKYQRRKKRSARGQLLAAVVLIVLAMVLAGVLIWVVLNAKSPPASPAATDAVPVAPPAEAAPADETTTETDDEPPAPDDAG